MADKSWRQKSDHHIVSEDSVGCIDVQLANFTQKFPEFDVYFTKFTRSFPIITDPVPEGKENKFPPPPDNSIRSLFLGRNFSISPWAISAWHTKTKLDSWPSWKNFILEFPWLPNRCFVNDGRNSQIPKKIIYTPRINLKHPKNPKNLNEFRPFCGADSLTPNYRKWVDFRWGCHKLPRRNRSFNR